MNDDSIDDARPVGRPGRFFRERLISYINDYVHSAEQLTCLAALLGRDENTLRRWMQEDAPNVALPLGGDMVGIEQGLGRPGDHIAAGVLGEVQRGLLERQKTFLIETLRQHVRDMNLGELRAILNSRLGRMVSDVSLRALVDDEALASEPVEVVPTVVRPALTRTPILDAAERSFATGPPEPPERRESEVQADADGSPEPYEEAILAYLRGHPGWNRPSDMRQHVGGTDNQFRDAVTQLRERGLIERRGNRRTTEYSLMPADESSQELQEHAELIIEALRDTPGTGGTMKVSELRDTTGCTEEQVRRALHLLLQTKQVDRAGSLANARYGLAGTQTRG